MLCLISGGGSALLAVPGGDITLADKQAINRALLRSGAHIGEMNCVRKHLSAIKGGRLAVAAAPARVVSLIISDVPGDDLSVIASGPTVARRHDPRRRAGDPREIRHRRSAGGAPGDSPIRSRDAEARRSALRQCRQRLIATPQDRSEAAATWRARRGSRRSSSATPSRARRANAASFTPASRLQAARYGQPLAPPCVILSGGETTVTVRGEGRGGRNAEFLLSLAIALGGRAGISALAADTDGIDGSEDNAGAIIGPDTLTRAARAGLDLAKLLADNDAYAAFAALGDLIVTGPTRTNVNDFRAILVSGRGEQGRRASSLTERGLFGRLSDRSSRGSSRVRLRGRAGEQSLPFFRRGAKEGITRLDALLKDLELEPHAGDLLVEGGIIARLAPGLESEHPAIECLMRRNNGRDGDVGREMLQRHPAGSQRDIRQFREFSGEFELRRKTRQVDHHAAFLQMR